MFLRNSIAKNSFPFQFYPLKVAEGKPFSKNTGIKILGRDSKKGDLFLAIWPAEF